eukprot:63346-Chlamydomonas_euryale.AAC.1
MPLPPPRRPRLQHPHERPLKVTQLGQRNKLRRACAARGWSRSRARRVRLCMQGAAPNGRRRR